MARVKARARRGRRVAFCGALLIAFAVASIPVTHAAPAKQRYVDQLFPTVRVVRDLVYGQAPVDGQPQTLKLDLYRPADDLATGRVAVVFAHGGAFTQGDKASSYWIPTFIDLAKRGFVVASINFRITGEERAATDDMQAAVRWFRANAATYRIDPTKIIAMGSSSGAIQALQVAFHPEDPGNSGNPGYPSNVAAAIAVSYSTMENIGPGEPPIAVFQSIDDTTNTAVASEGMCAMTRAFGNTCEMFRYQDGGHGRSLLVAHGPEIHQQAADFVCRNVLGPLVCTPKGPAPSP